MHQTRQTCVESVCIIVATLTSLAVTPSVTLGRVKMQNTVMPSLTRSMDSETDGHAITVAFRCGESVVKLTICSGVSISHAPCLPCLINTMSCSNHCMLTLCCLITDQSINTDLYSAIRRRRIRGAYWTRLGRVFTFAVRKVK